MLRGWIVVGFACALSSLVVACGGAPSGGARSASGGPAPGERIWRSKCGACHVPVQPGTRERAYLETAFKRHRARVRLSEPEWSSLVDFLAKPPADVAASK
jgi:hypothetical protein